MPACVVEGPRGAEAAGALTPALSWRQETIAAANRGDMVGVFQSFGGCLGGLATSLREALSTIRLNNRTSP